MLLGAQPVPRPAARGNPYASAGAWRTSARATPYGRGQAPRMVPPPPASASLSAPVPRGVTSKTGMPVAPFLGDPLAIAANIDAANVLESSISFGGLDTPEIVSDWQPVPPAASGYGSGAGSASARPKSFNAGSAPSWLRPATEPQQEELEARWPAAKEVSQPLRGKGKGSKAGKAEMQGKSGGKAGKSDRGGKTGKAGKGSYIEAYLEDPWEELYTPAAAHLRAHLDGEIKLDPLPEVKDRKAQSPPETEESNSGKARTGSPEEESPKKDAQKDSPGKAKTGAHSTESPAKEDREAKNQMQRELEELKQQQDQDREAKSQTQRQLVELKHQQEPKSTSIYDFFNDDDLMPM